MLWLYSLISIPPASARAGAGFSAFMVVMPTGVEGQAAALNGARFDSRGGLGRARRRAGGVLIEAGA